MNDENLNNIPNDKNEIINNASLSENNLIDLKNHVNYIKNNNDKEDSNSLLERENSFNSNNLSNLSSLYKNFLSLNGKKNNNNDMRNRTIYRTSKTFKRISLTGEYIGNLYLNENLDLYNIIKDKILDVKGDILQYLEQTKQKLELKYNNYIKRINEFLLEKENKLSKLLEGNTEQDNFINYVNDNLFRKIDDILEIHDYIITALEDHFNLLYSFLDQSYIINQKKPIEFFLDKNSSDIINCWVLNKFDFQQINLSEIITNKEFCDLFTGYLSKINNKDYSSIYLHKDNKEKFPLEIKLLSDNIDKVKKLKFIGLSQNDIYNINQQMIDKINKEKKNAKKVRSLSIIDCDFKYKDLLELSFPSLKKLKYKNSIMKNSYLFKYIIGETNSLVQINMEKIDLKDNDLKVFFESLSKKNSIQNTLKILSFKKNILTKISLDNFNIDNNKFNNLQYLNFSKNNIYEVSEEIIKLMPKLKVIDLTDNNISHRNLFVFLKEGTKLFKFIAFLSNNIFIHNNNSNNIEYIKYISENLSTFQHKIKKISFGLTFNRDNISYFTKIIISPAVKISLYKLDLSFCGITDDHLLKFFKNNYGFFNLEHLNLSNNYLTDNIFNLFNGDKKDIFLEKLNTLDLSFNNINFREKDDLASLNKFIDNHQEIKKIKLQYTNFIEGFNNLIKNSNYEKEINNLIEKLSSRNIKIVLENELSNVESEILSNSLIYKDKNY